MITEEFRLDWSELSREGLRPYSLKEGEALAGIETTSLSFRQGFVSMAFAACYQPPETLKEADSGTALSQEALKEGMLICRCLLCESRRDEEALLTEFRRMLMPFSSIQTYGGSIFSLRFLDERWILYSDDSFFTDDSVQKVKDIYEELRPFRKCFPISSLKKSETEAFAGYERRDSISGREIAQTYQEWENTKEPALKRRLLDHLKEDTLSLLSMTKLLGLPHLFDTSSIEGIQIEQLQIEASSIENMQMDASSFGHLQDIRQEQKAPEHCNAGELPLMIKIQLSQRLPFPVQAVNHLASLEGRDEHVRICLNACRGRLKHFLTGSYKEYYYLPEEDMTVHKSVAQAVARTRRVKATARTCFLAREGIFLPAPPKTGELLLWSRDYEDKDKYVLYEGENRLKPYLFALLGSLVDECHILLV